MDVALFDPSGTWLADFEHPAENEPPQATGRSIVEGRAADVARAVRARFRRHLVRILDRSDVAEALFDIGGVAERHSLLMVLDLAGPQPATLPPTDIVLEPMTIESVAEYAAVVRRAYPSDHPDHEPDDDSDEQAQAMIEAYLGGEVVGPFLAEASWVARADARVVGGS